MKAWLQSAIVACALCVAALGADDAEARGAAAIQNPYQQQFSELAQQVLGAGISAPEQAALLHRAYELRDYLDDRAALTKLVERVASSGVHPLVRDEAQTLLAQIDRHRGRLEAAGQRYVALGYLRKWSIVGPFVAADGLDGTYGPESTVVARSYTGAHGEPITWRAALDPGSQPWIDLADYFSANAPAVAFATTFVHSDTMRPAALRVGADGAFRVWLNGAVVARETQAAVAAFDQHTYGIVLQPGWNTVLIESQHQSGAWRFAARITAPQGGGLALRQEAAPQQPFAAAATAAATPGDDLLAMARFQAEASGLNNATAAQRLSALAALEQARAAGTPLEHADAAARRAPTAARWLMVARLCGDAACEAAALRAALHADPKSSAAHTALAAYYFGRDQLEKARDLYREALRLAPGDFVARKKLADVLAAGGRADLAAAEYDALAREYPSPLWLQRELAGRYEAANLLERASELATAALGDNFDGATERALLLRIAERRGDATALEQQYRALTELHPGYAMPRLRLATLAAGSGNTTAASAELRGALETDPANEQAHRQLGELLASTGQKAEAATHLTQVHATGAANEDWESPYLVNVEQLATAAHRAPPAGAPATSLAEVRIERVQSNGLSASRTQQVVYIASEEGARQFATRTLQYAPATQELRLMHLRVHKADGRVLEGEDGGDTLVSDAGIAMYYDVRARRVHFRNVERGDVLEIDYRITPATRVNPYGDYFGELLVMRSELPQRLNRFVLIAPASRKLTVQEVRMPQTARTSERNGEKTWQWDVHGLPAVAREPRAPALIDVSPYIHVSTFQSWDELGRWYAALIAPQFRMDAALHDALQPLVAGKKTELEKIRAIHAFVLRNTHYVALEFGIYSYKPYAVSQVYARRFGDCKDKASLMIALLRAAGIPAELALVRTRRIGEVAPETASVAIFNHAIVYVPGQDLWLDGTAEYAGARELPLDDQGATAFTVDAAGSAALRHIPLSGPLDNYSRRSVVARIQGDGTVHFSGNSYTRGEDAPGLRRGYEVAERQLDFFRNRLAEVLPSVKVDDVHVDDADLEHDVTVNFRGVLDPGRGKRSLALTSSWLPQQFAQNMTPLATRTEALLLPAPWTAEEEIRFELPAAASFSAVPNDVLLETRFGSASVRYERRSNALIVRTYVQFRQLRITPQEYGAFRDFCAGVERAFHAEVRVAVGG